MFYEKSDIDERFRQYAEAHPNVKVKKSDFVAGSRKKSQISVLVSKFERDRNTQGIDRQLRENSCSNVFQAPDIVIRSFIENEENTLQAREQLAEKHLLTNLKTQKYG